MGPQVGWKVGTHRFQKVLAVAKAFAGEDAVWSAGAPKRG